ncbi:aspartate/glutamate racemase family protein [Caulobacter mirabilis]|uniref:Aspartate racemase n=1 Tax=Caulobacter mirabilis TaxID=69666 RepID=A0A2D2B416_9CAUL|nr:amino acid racemase [Caulobacter mirabilis]ATQ45009.1 aspartate racemase [Caulobacter mirabilis]
MSFPAPFEKVRITTPRRLGVLGGMGPLATADFYAKLIRLTLARSDQEHLPTVIASLPQIPDRTAAIIGSGLSPLPAMREALRVLEHAGVERVAIPCNTAHFWFDALQGATHLPLLHIVDAVAAALSARGLAPGDIVGLLATDGTLKAEIYQRRLHRFGYACATPTPHGQRSVMNAIRRVKAGEPAAATAALRNAVAGLREKGCAAVILACTELPLALPTEHSDVLLDATEALALACLRDAAPPP